MRTRVGSGNWHILMHGTTKHGIQYDQEPQASQPMMYYTKSGPAGDVMSVLANDPRRRQIAIAGLGVGTMAAYSRPNWRMTFYEIDPEVVRIANNPEYFTYLSESKSPIEIVLGDARLRIAAAANDFYHLDSAGCLQFRRNSGAYDNSRSSGTVP